MGTGPDTPWPVLQVPPNSESCSSGPLADPFTLEKNTLSPLADRHFPCPGFPDGLTLSVPQLAVIES